MPTQTNAPTAETARGAKQSATAVSPDSSTPTAITEVGPALIANGYLPIAIRRGEKRPENARWQAERLTPEDCADYNGGAGALCGVGEHPVAAMDVDTTNAALAEAFERWCLEHLGDAPSRIGQAPKRLLVYQAAEAGWRKQRSRQYRHGTDERLHHLEVLGAGQQFVAYGIHPGTGQPYRWIDLMGGITHWAAPDLTAIAEAQVVEAVAEFQRMAESDEYQMRSVVSPRTGAATHQGGRTAPASDDPFDGLAQPLGLTADEIRDYLRHLDPTDYDLWIRVGLAVHHESRGAQWGLILWNSWSSTALNYQGRSDLLSRWKGFRRAWA